MSVSKRTVFVVALVEQGRLALDVIEMRQEDRSYWGQGVAHVCLSTLIGRLNARVTGKWTTSSNVDVEWLIVTVGAQGGQYLITATRILPRL